MTDSLSPEPQPTICGSMVAVANPDMGGEVPCLLPAGHEDRHRGWLPDVVEKAAKYDAINTPELFDFVSAVTNEALHQREKWGVDIDGGKTDADWFWLIGYLAGKALHNPAKDDMEPVSARLHRIITVAAAAANWHAMALGTYRRMRPGTEAPLTLSESHQ